MKKYILTAIFLTFIAIAVMLAGTFTITTETADDPRIAEAFGSILNLKDATGNPRPANTAEVQGAVEVWMKQQTEDYEKRKNMQQFSPPPLTLGSPIELPQPSPGMLKTAPKPSPTLKPKK